MSEKLGRIAGNLDPETKSLLATKLERVDELNAKAEKKNRSKANEDLNKLTTNKYFSSLPIADIAAILKKNGFDPYFEDESGMEGIYTGRDGKINPLQVGPKTWLALSWHKMEPSGNWEVVTYLS